ncbi:hypothetical protein [Bradyrhizobium sp. SZCCHNS3014]|nr:hypothetical protein [Bradyrhizobium sp. SZCCHNS3014]
MRVIQTTAYVSDDTRRQRDEDEYAPAVTFAWFRNPHPNQPYFDGLPEALNEDPVDWLIGAQFSGRPEDMFRDALGAPFSNPAYSEREITALWNFPIIIEQSPPTEISFAALLKHSPIFAMGAFIGTHVAEGYNPVLMFVAVPAGIVIVGAASGISKGLEEGLHKRISSIFNGKRSKRSKNK